LENDVDAPLDQHEQRAPLLPLGHQLVLVVQLDDAHLGRQYLALHFAELGAERGAA
jgi:hypothetical protein